MKKAETGICGYELNNPDRDMFDSRVLAIQGGCNDCQFVGSCLTPCDSIRCLTPKEGRLVHLGDQRGENGVNESYFAVVGDENTRFVRVSEPDHLWAKASCITEEHVPNWARSQLGVDTD